MAAELMHRRIRPAVARLPVYPLRTVVMPRADAKLSKIRRHRHMGPKSTCVVSKRLRFRRLDAKHLAQHYQMIAAGYKLDDFACNPRRVRRQPGRALGCDPAHPRELVATFYRKPMREVGLCARQHVYAEAAGTPNQGQQIRACIERD